MDFAWNPENWGKDDLDLYTLVWVEKQFGSELSREISEVIRLYTKYNGRVKPKLLNSETYSLVNFRESEKVVNEYNNLLNKTYKIKDKLGNEYHNAFFELVEYPVSACSNLYNLYRATALNRLYAKQGRASTNNLSNEVLLLFEKDREITERDNKLLNGKWNHIADQNHISYTYWQQPDRDVKPETITITTQFNSEIGISVEESEPWIKIDNKSGTIKVEKRIWVYIDWNNLNSSESGIIDVKGSDGSLITIGIKAEVQDVTGVLPPGTFIEADGYISMEATSYKESRKDGEYFWDSITDLGRTGSGMTTFPGFIQKNETEPYMDYSVYSFEQGIYNWEVYISPINNYTSEGSLNLILTIDNQKPLILDIHKDFNWNQAVGENILKVKSEIEFTDRGLHNIRISSRDVGIVLQKIVLSKNRIPVSYLGPEESFRTVMESTNEY